MSVESSLKFSTHSSDHILFDDVIGWLAGNGYFREPIVVDRGEFAVRGGIIDVFPSNQTNPLRIEYEGEDIASIRSFEVATQRSISKITSTEVQPFDQQDLFMERSNPEEVALPLLLSDYKEKDYVVHVDHGIALFRGLKRMKLGKYEGEYLFLQYAGTDNSLFRLSRYAVSTAIAAAGICLWSIRLAIVHGKKKKPKRKRSPGISLWNC